MGFNMMNVTSIEHRMKTMNHLHELELQTELDLQKKQLKKMAKANLSEQTGKKMRWDGLLFWKKKKK